MSMTALDKAKAVLNRLEAWQDGARIAARKAENRGEMREVHKHRNAEENYSRLAQMQAEVVYALEAAR